MLVRAGHAAEHCQRRASSISRRMTERSRSSDDGLRCEFCRMSERMSTALGTSDFNTCAAGACKASCYSICGAFVQGPACQGDTQALQVAVKVHEQQYGPVLAMAKQQGSRTARRKGTLAK